MTSLNFKDIEKEVLENKWKFGIITPGHLITNILKNKKVSEYNYNKINPGFHMNEEIYIRKEYGGYFKFHYSYKPILIMSDEKRITYYDICELIETKEKLLERFLWFNSYYEMIPKLYKINNL